MAPAPDDETCFATLTLLTHAGEEGDLLLELEETRPRLNAGEVTPWI